MHRDLVERAMAGDREAFTELTRQSIGKLYAIARLILRDSERAEDATQEALVAAWRQLSALRDPDRFDAWLRRLLVRACYREAGKDQRQRRIATRVQPFATVGPDPGIGARRPGRAGAWLRDSRPDQRALVVLHYYLGLPLQETAEILGLPVGTVKSRLFRTTQQMRAALEADARLPLVGGRRHELPLRLRPTNHRLAGRPGADARARRPARTGMARTRARASFPAGPSSKGGSPCKRHIGSGPCPVPRSCWSPSLLLVALAAAVAVGTQPSIPPPVGPAHNGLIAFDSGDGNLYVADPDGTNARLFLDRERELRYPAWSPDGTRLAFLEMVATGTGRTDDQALVRVVDANGHGDRDLTNEPLKRRSRRHGRPTRRRADWRGRPTRSGSRCP